MAIGALALYISNESVTQFQPMNINFGIIPPLDHFVKGKRNKNAEISQRALAILEEKKAGHFGLPGFPECNFTMPLVVEMPGRCPKCGGRLFKRTGTSRKSGKQYTYYCCEHTSNRVAGGATCDFMTWDVPVKDDCPVCGKTMFKRAGKGYKRPYCINPECANFLPEDKRGYPRSRWKHPPTQRRPRRRATRLLRKSPPRKTATKTAAKKTTVKKTAKRRRTAPRKRNPPLKRRR